MISLSYTSVVSLKTLKIVSPKDEGPKTVKLFANRLNMGFDDASSDTPTQTLRLTPNDLTQDAPGLALDHIKFLQTSTITIFVEDNQADSDQTVIKSLVLEGSKGR